MGSRWPRPPAKPFLKELENRPFDTSEIKLLDDFRDDAEVRRTVGAYAKGMERHVGKTWEPFVKELLQAARAFPSGKG